jgi:hypothetical protein
LSYCEVVICAFAGCPKARIAVIQQALNLLHPGSHIPTSQFIITIPSLEGSRFLVHVIYYIVNEEVRIMV